MLQTFQRNVGPIVLFLTIVAVGVVAMAWYTLMIQDNGLPKHPRDKPSISQLGAAPESASAAPKRPSPVAGTREPRTRVTTPYRTRTPRPTVAPTRMKSPSPTRTSTAPAEVPTKSVPPVPTSNTPTVVIETTTTAVSTPVDAVPAE